MVKNGHQGYYFPITPPPPPSFPNFLPKSKGGDWGSRSKFPIEKKKRFQEGGGGGGDWKVIPLIFWHKNIYLCVSFFGLDQFGWYLWTRRPKQIPFRPLKNVFKKRLKKGTYKNFFQICPKLQKNFNFS